MKTAAVNLTTLVVCFFLGIAIILVSQGPTLAGIDPPRLCNYMCRGPMFCGQDPLQTCSPDQSMYYKCYQDIDTPVDPSSSAYSPDAFSELDLTTLYYDTLTDLNYVPMDVYDQRSHIPLGIRIKQRSMAWSSPNIDDFILINYELGNIGDHYLRDVYVNVWGYMGLLHGRNLLDPKGISLGNVAGFLRTWPAPGGCGFVDRVDVAYGMSHDGNPDMEQYPNQTWDYRSVRAAVGIRILGMPEGVPDFNFNWSTQTGDHHEPCVGPNWGPRRASAPGDPFRTIGSSLGCPEGDDNNYYVMAHREFDYDQMFSNVDHTAEGWLSPPTDAFQYAEGLPAKFSQSAGPFDLPPHDIVEFTIAVIGGDSVHVNPTDFANLFPYPHDDPWPYYNSLDFSRLAENAKWADWIYDNPGYDTDGDGFSGLFHICAGDTQWYKGDGVPDFRADFPPPSPFVKVIPSSSKLVIRWNGYLSENIVDPFTQVKDFEGYRVYVGLDGRKTSLSLLSSFDYENYNRYQLEQNDDGNFVWHNRNYPFRLDTLKTIYDDSLFNPLAYIRLHPLDHNDTLYYFTRNDFNVSDLSDPRNIHKVYPEAPYPNEDSSQWQEEEITYEHGDPLPKYYEYEYVYDKLLSTVTYFVGVTAFDFGSPGGGIPPKESNLLNNLTVAYAQMSADSVEAYQLEAYVYPNPYRADEDYLERGFENRDRSGMRSRARRIHFGNLPNVCKISIYSLDGDLVRELDHNFPEGGPQAMHESWDFITRNAMLVMPGLYYYVIESEDRTQIGKFAIIM